MKRNEKIAAILKDIAQLLDIQGVAFKPPAYRRAAASIEALTKDIGRLYRQNGTQAIRNIRGVGARIAQKIEEYLKKGKITYYEELKDKTIIRQIVTHFFETKGVPLGILKRSARKRDIIYGRYAKAARELFELAGSVSRAKEAITKVAQWAKTRDLDYSLETVLKKWLELEQLKPKEPLRKAFYKKNPMVWDETKKKWFVVTPEGDWLEFAGDKKDIEWRIVK